jgi:hypothetical protein
MIRTSPVHHCRAYGSTHIVKNERNRSGSRSTSAALRGEQGAASQATLQQGAQGRGAYGPIRSVPRYEDSAHLRDHAQNDHAVAKKNS